ncbi:MAG: hypothetical protein ABI632_04895 [Pseudolysinimonas sp.]
MTSPEAVATAPVIATPRRNRVGIAALVLALIAIALPILVLIVATIGAAIEGPGTGSSIDQAGWNVLGGFILSAIAIPLVSPIAIVALVLGIIGAARKGYRKVQAFVAIVLSVAPAAAVFFIPTALSGM